MNAVLPATGPQNKQPYLLSHRQLRGDVPVSLPPPCVHGAPAYERDTRSTGEMAVRPHLVAALAAIVAAQRPIDQIEHIVIWMQEVCGCAGAVAWGVFSTPTQALRTQSPAAPNLAEPVSIACRHSSVGRHRRQVSICERLFAPMASPSSLLFREETSELKSSMRSLKPHCRAFDHYYGSLKGVRGFNDRTALLLRSGLPAFFQPSSQSSPATEYILPFPAKSLTTSSMCMNAPAMDYVTDMLMWNSGRYDSWNTGRSPGLGMSYFNRR